MLKVIDNSLEENPKSVYSKSWIMLENWILWAVCCLHIPETSSDCLTATMSRCCEDVFLRWPHGYKDVSVTSQQGSTQAYRQGNIATIAWDHGMTWKSPRSLRWNQPYSFPPQIPEDSLQETLQRHLWDQTLKYFMSLCHHDHISVPCSPIYLHNTHNIHNILNVWDATALRQNLL